MSTENPKVSVSIITYQHERYVGRAIESVLQQRVDFPYEVIIGDDFSTDGTREILRQYQQQYPNIIQLVLHPRRYDNVPGRTNNITNLYACRGQYVALLDGDDYWTSTDKLQTQVDFLDRRPDYALAFHDALKVYDDPAIPDERCSKKYPALQHDNTFTQQDILSGWGFVPTSSIVFRNGLVGEFPEWFWKVIAADYALLIQLTQHGKMKYFCQVNGVYQQHGQSFTNVHNRSLETMALKIKELQLYKEQFLPPALTLQGYYRRARLAYRLDQQIAMYRYNFVLRLRHEKRYRTLIRYLLSSAFKNLTLLFYLKMLFVKVRHHVAQLSKPFLG